jgi:penicillin-binding protein 1A
MINRAFNKFARNTLWALISLSMFVVFTAVSLYLYMLIHLPKVTALRDVHLQVPLRVYTADKKLIAEFGTKRRIPVDLNQVPKPLVQALLATEDNRFFEHKGIDFISLIRAARAVLLTGKKVQGASTITMQVARNFFLSQKKTYLRKINEILLAIRLEQIFNKQKILELYLNKIYFGERAYGVAAAAQVYYGKTLQQLTLSEMAMLAGLPQAPSSNNPVVNPESARLRRNHVLERMLNVGYITQQEYQQAVNAPLTAKYYAKPIQMHAGYVAEMVRDALVKRWGPSVYESGLSVYTTIDSSLQLDSEKALQQGLMDYSRRHGFYGPIQNLGGFSVDEKNNWQDQLKKVPVVGPLQPAAVIQLSYQSARLLLSNGDTIDIPWSGLSWARRYQADASILGAIPKKASDILKPGDVVYVTHQNNQWMLSQLPRAQGALAALDPQTGALKALMGGMDFRLSNFNRALQAKRQAGSSFKPFIYSAALNKGYTLATVVNDAPVVMRDTGENEWWRPQNDNNQFDGPTRLRIGLMRSRNLVSIRLLQRIGIDYTTQYVQRFGFDQNSLPHSLSLALGAVSVTPLEMVDGYSIFANGGYRVIPYFIQEITDQNQNILYQADPPTACRTCLYDTTLSMEQLPLNKAPEVITPQNAYLINSVLSDVITHGTARRARVLNRSDIAGKTGTTNNQVDAWFVGYNSNIVTAVWVGFDNLQSLNEYGSQVALPIWIDFMKMALHGKPQQRMPQPPGIVTVRIDPETGLLANSSQTNGVFEIFREQYVPKEVAEVDNTTSDIESTTSDVSDNSNNNTDTPEQNAQDDETQIFY